ncbi:hypothetical protein CALVIDRAFT_598573 [Calocera viscosa TUFC12733]|uniref:Uncharacterized protein n=1 Tax=Calocera viscosa (strain TUFC12733) TaxID=1330018 RepID=A0A167M2N1_CALVF|nr:hypothetical protein CALVIDRAFT_598573 [Calocera viscosa TUFC12733]
MRPLIVFAGALAVGFTVALPVNPSQPQSRDVLREQLGANAHIDKRHKRKPKITIDNGMLEIDGLPEIKIENGGFVVDDTPDRTISVPVAAFDRILSSFWDQLSDNDLVPLLPGHRQRDEPEHTHTSRARSPTSGTGDPVAGSPFNEHKGEPTEGKGSDHKKPSGLPIDPSKFTVDMLDELSDEAEQLRGDDFEPPPPHFGAGPPRPRSHSISNAARQLDARRSDPISASIASDWKDWMDQIISKVKGSSKNSPWMLQMDDAAEEIADNEFHTFRRSVGRRTFRIPEEKASSLPTDPASFAIVLTDDLDNLADNDFLVAPLKNWGLSMAAKRQRLDTRQPLLPENNLDARDVEDWFKPLLSLFHMPIVRTIRMEEIADALADNELSAFKRAYRFHPLSPGATPQLDDEWFVQALTIIGRSSQEMGDILTALGRVESELADNELSAF